MNIHGIFQDHMSTFSQRRLALWRLADRPLRKPKLDSIGCMALHWEYGINLRGQLLSFLRTHGEGVIRNSELLLRFATQETVRDLDEKMGLGLDDHSLNTIVSRLDYFMEPCN